MKTVKTTIIELTNVIEAYTAAPSLLKGQTGMNELSEKKIYINPIFQVIQQLSQ